MFGGPVRQSPAWPSRIWRDSRTSDVGQQRSRQPPCVDREEDAEHNASKRQRRAIERLARHAIDHEVGGERRQRDGVRSQTWADRLRLERPPHEPQEGPTKQPHGCESENEEERNLELMHTWESSSLCFLPRPLRPPPRRPDWRPDLADCVSRVADRIASARGPPNTGDKLRASNMLNARQLHPLVLRLRPPPH